MLRYARDYKYERDFNNFWFYYLFFERKALKQIKIRFAYCTAIQAISILAKKDCKGKRIENLRGLTKAFAVDELSKYKHKCDKFQLMI